MHIQKGPPKKGEEVEGRNPPWRISPSQTYTEIKERSHHHPQAMELLSVVTLFPGPCCF